MKVSFYRIIENTLSTVFAGVILAAFYVIWDATLSRDQEIKDEVEAATKVLVEEVANLNENLENVQDKLAKLEKKSSTIPRNEKKIAPMPIDTRQLQIHQKILNLQKK